jgi:type VI secretion system secreted protein Hcp
MRNWIRNCVMSAVLAGSLMATQLANAAVSMVAKIGDIKGESALTGHSGEIDVLSYSWGVVQSNARVGGGGAGKATVNALTLTKYVDASSPMLFIDSAQGKVMPQAQFTIIKMGGKSPVEMIKLKLDNVMVTSVTTGTATADGRFTETITLVFSVVEYTYTPQKSDGSAGAAVTVKWNATTGARL